MEGIALSAADREQLRSLGITEDGLREQIRIFEKPSFKTRLRETCTLKNCIHRIEREDAYRYVQVHERAAHSGRFLKFVPASGAATRMFKFLFQIQDRRDVFDLEKLKHEAQQGDSAAGEFVQFMENLPRFAFYEDLREVMSKSGLDPVDLISKGEFKPLLDYLLTGRGLDYGSLPKGLISFHRYPGRSRTAFEEHLVEAAHYVRSSDGSCRIHFTAAPGEEERFKSLFHRVRSSFESLYEVRFLVGFSVQKHSTDTVAVDLSNRPLRDRDGHLVFRPGGHGALLENLNELQDDFVYIKNIDNVVPDHLKESTYFWKRVLGGFVVELQGMVHERLLLLEKSQTAIEEVEKFAREKLFIQFPAEFAERKPEEKSSFLFSKLNRPIRVCGVVPNVGEPGGAPFWVGEDDGTSSIQIVEKAQVDFDSPEQERIWNSSTHFNPVDIVCGIRDYRGNLFDLLQYRNPEAVFISKKSYGGREIKALELPGLWNGGMADWISVFVEVPRITFNPVKTVNDLLRPEHQPV